MTTTPRHQATGVTYTACRGRRSSRTAVVGAPVVVVVLGVEGAGMARAVRCVGESLISDV